MLKKIYFKFFKRYNINDVRYYIFSFLDIFIIILGIYVLYNYGINYKFFIQSIIILFLILLYWFITVGIMGMGLGSLKDQEKVFSNLSDLEIWPIRFYKGWNFFKYQKKYADFLIFKLSPDQLIIYNKFIRIFILFFPSVWFYLFVHFLNLSLFYLKLILNGIIDVILKKYFNIFWDKNGLNYNNKIWYKIFCWMIKYPLLRLLFYPAYLRIRFINKDWKNILKLRIIVYFLMTYLFFLGYSELLIYILQYYILLFICIYLYFAFLFPLLLYWYSKIFKGEVELFLYPSLFFIYTDVYTEYSLTLYLFNNFFVLKIMTPKHVFLYVYLTSRLSIFKSINIFLLTERVYVLIKPYLRAKNAFLLNPVNQIYCDYGRDSVNYINIDVYKWNNLNLWKYEKYYYIPCFSYSFLFKLDILENIIVLEAIWQEGLSRYGLMFMDYKYGQAYEQMLYLFKCWLFLIFDLKRLTGVNFNYNRPAFEQLFEFKMELSIEDVPNNLNLLDNLMLYKDIISILNFFYYKRLNFDKISYIPELFAKYITLDLGDKFFFSEVDINKRVNISSQTKEFKQYSQILIFLKDLVLDYVDNNNNENVFLSLVDRLELDVVGMYGVCAKSNYEFYMNINQYKQILNVTNYKNYLKENYIKCLWKEYNYLLDNGLYVNNHHVEVSKKTIKEYVFKFSEIDKKLYDDSLCFLFEDIYTLKITLKQAMEELERLRKTKN